MKKKRIYFGLLSLACICLSLFLYGLNPIVFQSFENSIKDTMFIMRGEAPKDQRIVIVDIDETSIKALGQWPWSRDILARIINNISYDKPKLMGLDMIFAEKDKNSPKKLLTQLGFSALDARDYDEELSLALKKIPSVLGFFTATNDKAKAQNEPNVQAFISEKHKGDLEQLPVVKGLITNIDILNQSALSSGFINYQIDVDPFTRKVPTLIKYDMFIYPSLLLEMSRILLGSKNIVVNYQDGNIINLRIGKSIIPTDPKGFLQINYTGKSPAYPYISAIDVYKNKQAKGFFDDKIILLGTSAMGLHDLRSSPFSSSMPGVEAHAHLIDNILNNNFISYPLHSYGIDLICIVLIPIICMIFLLFSRIVFSVILGFILAFVIFYSHFILMFHAHTMFSTFILHFEIMFMYFFGTFINYFLENRQKELIKSKFARKVSSLVMDDIIASDALMKTSTKEISIFFSDIRNFTKISEEFTDPTKLISFLNSYMTPMTEIIISHGGTVDKFMGDSIMAYWNAPNELKNHADLALKSAIEQMWRLKKLNEHFKQNNLPSLDIGIGLNTGVCIVGEMGSIGRSDYTCLGDSVNVAARLEQLNKKYKTNIIVSKDFIDHLSKPEIYEFEELNYEQIVGKSIKVQIFACYGYKNQPFSKKDLQSLADDFV